MAEYDRTNTFVLFINDKKGNEARPDRTGTLNVDGVDYYIDGWLKNGAKGPFLSGSIKRKDAAKTTAKQQVQNLDADDIPF